jgi:hypothetical protein
MKVNVYLITSIEIEGENPSEVFIDKCVDNFVEDINSQLQNTKINDVEWEVA